MIIGRNIDLKFAELVEDGEVNFINNQHERIRNIDKACLVLDVGSIKRRMSIDYVLQHKKQTFLGQNTLFQRAPLLRVQQQESQFILTFTSQPLHNMLKNAPQNIHSTSDFICS